MKILEVDDNPDIVQFMEMTIQSLGHEFDSAPGGKEGLEKIRNEKYDLVFLDLSMPDFTGIDVIDALEAEGILDKQKIILFTASYLGLESLEKDLMNKGIYAILAKPADIDQIMEKIDEVEASL